MNNNGKDGKHAELEFDNQQEEPQPEPTWLEKTQAIVENAKAMAKSKPTVRRRNNKKPIARDFESTQLNLFQNFLCNTKEERSELSNAMDLWDSIPRYSVSRLTMGKLRGPQGNLKLLKIDFKYRTKALCAVIQPAKIEVEGKDGELIELDFYPSAAEELIEDALRKIATEQQQGFFSKEDFRSGVVFSLHDLRRELTQRGHTRSLPEIIMSLRILAKSNIEIIDSNTSGEGIAVSAYLPALAGVTRKDLEADPGAKWVAQFHPLITQAIDQLTYRQFNYHQLMKHKTQLARWLHKQIALKFTFASIGRTFEMKLSTILRDSALLNGYAELRVAVTKVDEAFAELTPDVLMFFEKKVIRGERNKIENVVYTLSPSRDFIHGMKASHKRLSIGAKRLGLSPDSTEPE